MWHRVTLGPTLDPVTTPPVIESPDGRWSFDLDFLASNWRCLWGDGCQGIEDHPTPEHQHGCCSLGAELLDEDEAMELSANAACVDPARFEHHAAAGESIFADATRRHTRVVDGACIFFNSVGFVGGVGCALHLEALAQGESPIDWKPSICWQLPIKIDHGRDIDGASTHHLRPWRRTDWGPGGEAMAWCCTQRTDATAAWSGDEAVIDSLSDEIEALVGGEVMVELRGLVARHPSG